MPTRRLWEEVPVCRKGFRQKLYWKSFPMKTALKPVPHSPMRTRCGWTTSMCSCSTRMEMSVKKEAGFTVILIQQRMIMERLQEILSLRPVRKTMRKLRVLPTSRRATSTPLMNSRKTSWKRWRRSPSCLPCWQIWMSRHWNVRHNSLCQAGLQTVRAMRYSISPEARTAKK